MVVMFKQSTTYLAEKTGQTPRRAIASAALKIGSHESHFSHFF